MPAISADQSPNARARQCGDDVWRRAIGGAAVNNDHLDIDKGLRQGAGQGLTHIEAIIKTGYDDGNKRRAWCVQRRFDYALCVR